MYAIFHLPFGKKVWRCVTGAVLTLLVTLIAAMVYPTAPSSQASAENVPKVELPIIMYHGLLKEKKRLGRYVVSPAEFESDLRYLKENGYTTIVIQDLLDYVHGTGELPEKPIMLTFDDGYYNNYLYAFPLLKQYDSKIVLSPIGRYTEEYSRVEDNHANYSHVTWPQLREMIDSGLVEVQNHTYNLHASSGGRKGSKKKVTESLAEYRSFLQADVLKLQQRMQEETGYSPTAFVYPFGAVSPEALPILKEMGFQATLGCTEKVNKISADPDSLYELGRFLRPSGPSSEAFFKKILS